MRFRDGVIESDDANVPSEARLMFWNAIVLALREIRRNVLRSSLTILGIVIGVAAVITMVTIGEGATAQVQADIQKLGTNLLQVFRGQGFGGGGGARSDRAAVRDRRRRARSRTRSAGVRAVAPTARSVDAGDLRQRELVDAGHGHDRHDFCDVRDWPLASGRNFSESRAARRRRGMPARRHRAPGAVRRPGSARRDACGSASSSCQVIGLLTPRASRASARTRTTSCVMPLRTLQRRIAGNTDVGAILVSARDGVSTTKVQADIESSAARAAHRSAPAREDDFSVRDMKEIASTLTSSTRVLTALLGAVAAVSLLVGGVGIMNIMLVSVTERTREIGIAPRRRRAWRAMCCCSSWSRRSCCSAVGGLVGIVLGLSRRRGRTHAIDVPFVFKPASSCWRSRSRPRSASCSATSRRAVPRGSIRSRRCVTSSCAGSYKCTRQIPDLDQRQLPVEREALELGRTRHVPVGPITSQHTPTVGELGGAAELDRRLGVTRRARAGRRAAAEREDVTRADEVAGASGGMGETADRRGALLGRDAGPAAAARSTETCIAVP